MESLPIDLLYQVAAAILARQSEKVGEVQDASEQALNNLNPPERVVQTRREDGMLEHDPNMEIPGWGFGDPDEMGWGPPASASSGAVEDFDPT